jgi:hypothetical protein
MTRKDQDSDGKGCKRRLATTDRRRKAANRPARAVKNKGERRSDWKQEGGHRYQAMPAQRSMHRSLQ